MATKTLTPIKKVVGTMVSPLPELDQPQEKIKLIESQIQRVRSLNGGSFFKFESFTEEVQEAIDQLRTEQSIVTMAMMGYPEIDHGFLAWRQKNTKMPAFMVLDLENNRFSISVEPYNGFDEQHGKVDHGHTEFEFSPDLPKALEDHFTETVKYLANLSAKSYSWNQIEISTEFRGGIMPQDLREKVKSASNSKLFNRIFVIAEAVDWEINEIVRAKGDPLVVGWVESTKRMYLIGVYDPTPLEQYIREQMIK